MNRLENYDSFVGKKYSNLTIKSWSREYTNYGTVIKVGVRCDCGKDVVAFLRNLTNGHTKSCGCRQHVRVAPDYIRGTRVHIIARCTNPNNPAYKNYGGRGITVCKEWQGRNGLKRFYEDMGDRPSPKHSIDRINVDGNYEPSNCRWATPKEQANNTRAQLYLSVARVAELSGYSREGVRLLYKQGFLKKYFIGFYSGDRPYFSYDVIDFLKSNKRKRDRVIDDSVAVIPKVEDLIVEAKIRQRKRVKRRKDAKAIKRKLRLWREKITQMKIENKKVAKAFIE